MEATTDQTVVVVPPDGQKFLWVSAKLASAPQTIDLTKIAIVNATARYPLLGVDSAFGGDPKMFSMIAPVPAKKGGIHEPLEESRSIGIIAFAFTPGKSATLKVNDASAAFCLLFAVPPTFQMGQVRGLAAQDIGLPPVKKLTM